MNIDLGWRMDESQSRLSAVRNLETRGLLNHDAIFLTTCDYKANCTQCARGQDKNLASHAVTLSYLVPVGCLTIDYFLYLQELKKSHRVNVRASIVGSLPPTTSTTLMLIEDKQHHIKVNEPHTAFTYSFYTNNITAITLPLRY